MVRFVLRAPLAVGAALSLMLVAQSGAAQTAPVGKPALPTLNDRVSKLERLVNTGTLMDLFKQVEALQNELRELRGEIEQQSHNLERIKQQQRDLYLDVDRRLRRAESGAMAAVPGVMTTPPPVIGADGQPVTPPAGTPPVTAQPVPGATEIPPAPGVQPVPVQPQPAQPGVVAGVETPTPTGQPPVIEIDPAKEQEAYQQAFNLLRGGRYNKASSEFQKFLKEYPSGTYSDNARYWLGETFYVTRRFEEALTEFNRLMVEHPASPKLPHAMLKAGYVHHELGDIAKAQAVLDELIANHPKTTAARLARERLLRMKSDAR